MTLETVEILLVEDNPGDVLLTTKHLKNAKVANRLHIVEDGEKALTFLHQTGEYADAVRPDLILLDLNLPAKGGCEVLAEIKQDPSLRLIPVVVLTSSQAEEDIVKAYGLHANCYIAKPVDLAEFTKVVKSIDEFWFSVVKLPPKTVNGDRTN